MEPIYLFQKIIGQANNVNDLPLLSTIYKEIEKYGENIDYDQEVDIMIDNWDGSKITLLDGTEIELIGFRACILHSFHDVEREYSYKIDDNLYICSGCLTILKEHKDLCEKYYSNCFEDLLFPRRWDRNRIILWLRKAEKREEEYYARKASYI